MELKQKRKDGKHANVIINEAANKEIQQYQVDALPHPFQSKEQFEYVANQPLSKEWTGVLHHDRLTKPAVKTRVGEVIAPILKPKARKPN